MRSACSSRVGAERVGALMLLCGLVAAFEISGCLVSFEDYPLGEVGAGAVAGAGGEAGNAGGGVASCGPELCDGLDNDCSGSADESPTCPTGCVGRSRDGKAYMFCSGPESAEDAGEVCARRDMSLVRIDDAAENDWLFTTSVQLGLLTVRWIGAMDQGHEGRWTWQDGTEFWNGGPSGDSVRGLFEAWDEDEPNNNGGGENCAVMHELGAWNDLPCYVEYPFICEEN